MNISLRLKWIFIYSILTLPVTLLSQKNNDLCFSRFTNEEGLPSNKVNSIVKDHLGFLWVATSDGLGRYDGENHFKVFRANDLSTQSNLKSSNIRALLTDSKQNLWIGTRKGGITRYHLPTNTWTAYLNIPNDISSLSNNDILSIKEDSKGRLWVGTENGLNLFDPKSNKFIRFMPVSQNDPKNKVNAILTIEEDDKGWLWLGTWANGLYLMLPSSTEHIQEATFRRFLPSDKMGSWNIWKFYQDNDQRYWLGTHGGGLFLMNLPPEANTNPNQQKWKAQFHNYVEDKFNHNTLSNNTIQTLYQDSEEKLWVGTVDGLSIIEKTELDKLPNSSTGLFSQIDLSFNRYDYNKSNPKTLVHSVLNDIYQDDDGLIWIGTDGGLSSYNWYSNQFDFHEIFTEEKGSPKAQFFSIDDEGIIWFSDGIEGVKKYDIENNRVLDFDAFGSKIPYKGIIRALYSPDNENYYVSDNEGIIRFNKRTLDWKKYLIPEHHKKRISDFDVRCLFVRDGLIWIGSEEGLFTINERTEEIDIYLMDHSDSTSISDNSITDILRDSKGTMWISTYDGLNKVIQDGNRPLKFKKYLNDPDNGEQDLPTSQLIALEEYNGYLYLGTINGLIGFDSQLEKFTNHSKEGYKFHITGLQISNKDGKLWASTREGIFSFDLENHLFNTFTEKNGLNDIHFRPNSSFSTQDGSIYFGSRLGITSLQPEKISLNRQMANIYVTEITTMCPNGTKQKNTTHQNNIKLRHDEYYLAISFASLNYGRLEENNFRYMLEGFDETWVENESEVKAVYTNLDPGKYTFKIMSTNVDGIWSESPRVFTVEKKPAFWQTLLFKLGVFIFLILAILSGIKLYTRAMRQRNQEMEGIIDSRTKELANKNKEVKALLKKIKSRNEQLEHMVMLRTQNLKASNEELTRSNHDLEQFAYIASHDLQEPLRTVGSYVSLLSRRYKSQLDDDAFEYIDFAVDGVRRMSNLIKSILTYSKVGRKEIKFKKTDLNNVLELKVLDLSQKLKDRKAKIEYNPMPNIICESSQIGMVFYNLINNGIKFNKQEEPIIRITHHEDAPEGFWKFSVQDNGIGISPEFHDKIFEIFRRLHIKTEYEGTGIGLALCQKIIQRHGGKIWVESDNGAGCTFFFTLQKKSQDLRDTEGDINAGQRIYKRQGG